MRVSEFDYVTGRAEEWVERHERAAGRSRREILRLAAAAVPALTAAALVAPKRAWATAAVRQRAATASGPIVKPLPSEWFIDYGSNAEMRWDTVDFGFLTPVERFFVRDHTSTPVIDPSTWGLRIFGSGLRGAPTADQAAPISYDELRRMPHRTLTSAIECAGNARSFFGRQQGTPVSGTPWQLGAVGVAEWTGVPLSYLLERAGITPGAVDVMPSGLDDMVVVNGADAGHVRRPFPVAKAMDDVLVAYAMNGEPLAPDHGAPARVVVPGWVGVSNIKWVGQIEVADHALFSNWNTTQYRMIGPDYPPDYPPLTNQVVKSAFQLARGATVPRRRLTTLRGRSWSRAGRHRARRHQPATVPYNSGGYLFGAVVQHPVTVSA